MKKLARFLPLGIIALFSVLLFLANYKPGTFLIGWDNLFPEFNFSQDFQRNLFAVWQEYRGLGLIDGMSHAANLMHDIQRFTLSLFLPTSLIRWAYIFIMHLAGGLGMYMLLQSILSEMSEKKSGVRAVSVVGALFYQYNLATLQQFFLPFEVFVVHFAALPWLLYTAHNFVKSGTKRVMIALTFVFLLSLPQAYVPTLFIVSVIALLIFLIATILTSAGRKIVIKRAGIILLTAVAVNAYWGFPFAYATPTNSQTIASSKNFEMATNDIFYRNYKYGDLTSIALLKGLSFDFQHYNFKTKSQSLMMQPWVDHLRTPFFLVPAWIFFAVALIGMFAALKQKKKQLFPFILIFFIGFSLLGTAVPLLREINELLRTHVPLFNTVFRFTFTKFSLLYALGYTVLLSYGLLTITRFLKQYWHEIAVVVTAIGLLTSYTIPSFRGHFFYENLAVNVPQEYIDVFSFFQQQNRNQRVAILPIPWYWAWLQPTWGTIGSGFIWYGIAQPITDLAFTPWSDKNENFYWELEQAVYSENTRLLSRVFQKYNIHWVYLDANILHAEARRMTYDRYEEIIRTTPGVTLFKKFRNIAIYQVQNNEILNEFVTIKENLPNILPTYQYDNYDAAFEQYGDYTSSGSMATTAYYPFRSLFSNKDSSKQEYFVEENKRSLIFKAKIPEQKTDSWISIPDGTEDLTVASPSNPNRGLHYTSSLSVNGDLVEASYSGQPENIYLPSVKDGWMTFDVPKEHTLVYDSNSDKKYTSQTNDGCEKNPHGEAILIKQLESGQEHPSLKLISRDSRNCIKAELPDFSHKNAYLVKVVASSSTVRGLMIDVYNETMKKTDLEIYLPHDGKRFTYYLIVPPRQPDGLGYTMYLNNISEGRERVENILYHVEVYQLPYSVMKHLKLQHSSSIASISRSTDIATKIERVSHPNSAYYRVSLSSKLETLNSTLVLSQAFHPGWLAFVKTNTFPYFAPLTDHLLVNNWANGWELKSSAISYQSSDCLTTDDCGLTTIVIFFLPQLLEFVGFALLPLPFLLLLRRKTP